MVLIFGPSCGFYMLWSGPLTSADLMVASGEGLNLMVAYQVLDETYLLFSIISFCRFTLSAGSCVCFWNNLNLVLPLTDSGLPWCVQRGGSKEGIPQLQDRAL
jgi:hypothetical protein